MSRPYTLKGDESKRIIIAHQRRRSMQDVYINRGFIQHSRSNARRPRCRSGPHALHRQSRHVDTCLCTVRALWRRLFLTEIYGIISGQEMYMFRKSSVVCRILPSIFLRPWNVFAEYSVQKPVDTHETAQGVRSSHIFYRSSFLPARACEQLFGRGIQESEGANSQQTMIDWIRMWRE